MINFKELMNTSEYDFLRNNERLGKRIILLGLGDSYACGTNNENSDIDFRGVTLHMASDLLGLTDFEQYEDANTDTVIYSVPFPDFLSQEIKDYMDRQYMLDPKRRLFFLQNHFSLLK